MSKRVREIMRRIAEQKEQRGIFYPTWFSDYGDTVSLYVTCPNCDAASLHEIPWKDVTKSWAGASFETTCPACCTVVTAYSSAHPGGRQGECQYEIVEASWDSNVRNRGLASKPPVHLFADAPPELPAFRKYTYFPRVWNDGTWLEVAVPEGWVLGHKAENAFLSSYGGILGLGLSKHVGLSGYEHVPVPPEIHSAEERTAFLMTRSSTDITFGASAPLTRHQFGPLTGFWSTEHKDGMSAGLGFFAHQEWILYASLGTPTKNYAYHWGCTQRIIASLKFYANNCS